MNFQEYIDAKILILIPVLYLIGYWVKKSNIADKWIPLILGAAGVVLSGLWTIATAEIGGWRDIVLAVFTAVVQGILVAGASVYVNQIVVQSKKEE